MTAAQQAASRWSLGFFFALVAFPFVAVWTLTQGPRTMDAWFPVYQIANVGKIEFKDYHLVMTDVVFEKDHTCHPNGILYMSAVFKQAGQEHEVLTPAERGASGRPFIVQAGIKPGGNLTIPDIRFIMTRDMMDKLDNIRLVVPCKRPWIGQTNAYTNTVTLR